MYEYATVVRATMDDPHPDNNIDEGDLIYLAGRHPRGYAYTVLDADDRSVDVEFETVEIYDLPGPLDETLAKQYAWNQRHEEDT